MNEVEEDILEQDAEQDIINRVPELKKLSGNINKATNYFPDICLTFA